MLPLPRPWLVAPRRINRWARRRVATLHWPSLRRRARRSLVGGALVVVFVACVSVAWAAVLARSAPRWWVTVKRDDPAVMTTARNIENQLFSRVSDDRGAAANDEWTVTIDAEAANAWLNVRLPMWLANQKERFRWPKEMSDLQVNFANNQITVGAKVHAGDRVQVLTATIEPRLRDDGRLYIPARWVSVGRLSVPAGWVIDRAHRSVEQYIPVNLRRLPETEMLFRAFVGDQPIKNNAVLNLQDGRAVRIVGMTTKEGTLRVTCRTERKEQVSR